MRCSYSVERLRSLDEVEKFVNVPFRIIYIEKIGGELYPCGTNVTCQEPVFYIMIVEKCEEVDG